MGPPHCLQSKVTSLGGWHIVAVLVWKNAEVRKLRAVGSPSPLLQLGPGACPVDHPTNALVCGLVKRIEHPAPEPPLSSKGVSQAGGYARAAGAGLVVFASGLLHRHRGTPSLPGCLPLLGHLNGADCAVRAGRSLLNPNWQ